MSADLKATFIEQLAALVPVQQGGVRKMMPQSEAMVRVMLSDFAAAKPRDRLALIRFIFERILPPSVAGEIPNGDIPPEALLDFLDGLAEEYRKLEALENGG